MNKLIIILFLFILMSCHEKSANVELEIIGTKNLCTDCMAPNSYLSNNDEVVLSYIERANDTTDQFMMRKLVKGVLGDQIQIAIGDNWFVNWADIPSVVSLDKSGTSLMAHWLQMKAEGTYDYDVRCAISKDNGQSWGESFVLHDDGIAAEHGFVTMVKADEGAFVTWLDGRNTKTPSSNSEVESKSSDHGEHEHGHGGTLPMSLRAAWVDGEGGKTLDQEIDNRVCDCCQTDAVMTNSGPVVVYRDRSEKEVRDISIARFVDGAWVHSVIHNDNWQIAGCPVNGPAIAYRDGLMAIAWYTQFNNQPKVFLITSTDDGKTFGAPILVDGNQPLGRVDIVITTSGEIVISWMNAEGENTCINASVYKDGVTVVTDILLAETSPSRSSGFPIMEVVDEELILVYTIVEEERTDVQLLQMKIK